jgi:hypothetical protein
LESLKVEHAQQPALFQWAENKTMTYKEVDETPSAGIYGKPELRSPSISGLLDKPSHQEFTESLASGIGVSRQSEAGDGIAFVPSAQHSIAEDAAIDRCDEVLI